MSRHSTTRYSNNPAVVRATNPTLLHCRYRTTRATSLSTSVLPAAVLVVAVAVAQEQEQPRSCALKTSVDLREVAQIAHDSRETVYGSCAAVVTLARQNYVRGLVVFPASDLGRCRRRCCCSCWSPSTVLFSSVWTTDDLEPSPPLHSPFPFCGSYAEQL